MAKSKVPHKLIPSEEMEMSVLLTPLSSAAAADVEEEKPDKQFWLAVCVY